MTDTLTGSISNSPEYNHQCIWQMQVTHNDETKVIGYPLTVDFSITRNTSAQSNNATFSIYNLAPSTRSSEFFFQDRFLTAKKKLVEFKAGYNNNLITIFKGYILESYSHRQGTDIITQMQCLDLGIGTDYVNTTIEAGTTYKEAYKTIAQNAENLNISAIGSLDGTFLTPTVFEGSVLGCLNQITGQHTFIDNNEIVTLQNNECLDTGVSILSADSGLLNTPQRHGGEIVAESIFNPNLQVGQLLEIQSSTSSEFTGTYKISGIQHSGTISGAVAGQRITRLNLFIGAFLPDSSYIYTGNTEKQAFSKVKNEEITPVNGDIGSDVISVYNYIRNNNGAIPNKKITERISWKEMLQPAGSKNTTAQILAQITIEYLQNCKNIAVKLTDYLKANYSGRTITVLSGWRSKENNASLKNASGESAHLRGAAIDFKINGVNSWTAFYSTFYKTWDKFTYMYKAPSSWMIHVQSTLGKNGAKRASTNKR